MTELVVSRESYAAGRVRLEHAEWPKASQDLVGGGEAASELVAELGGGPAFFAVLPGERCKYSALAVAAE